MRVRVFQARKCRSTPRGAGNAGFVLIAVLTVMALLSTLVIALALVTRTSIETSLVATERLAGDALIQAGVEMAGFQLFARKAAPSDLSGQQIRLDDGVVTLFASSVAGRIDLNGAPPEILAGLYETSGLRTLTPGAFAARVLDWRDANVEMSENGAEADAYQNAGLGYTPANKPFRNVSDLRFVFGVSAADVAVLMDDLTVYNPGGKIDFATAAPAVLRSLPDIEEPDVETLLTLRRAGAGLADERVATLLERQEGYLAEDQDGARLVRIEAVPVNGRVAMNVEAVMIRSTVPGRLYQIVGWREL